MAIGDTHAVRRTLREIDPAAARHVMHFDQLDHDQQDAFIRLLRGEQRANSLPINTVIVFTNYYRVEPA